MTRHLVIRFLVRYCAFIVICLTVCSTEEVKQNVEKAMKDVVDPIRTKVGPTLLLLPLPPSLSLPLFLSLSLCLSPTKN